MNKALALSGLRAERSITLRPCVRRSLFSCCSAAPSSPDTSGIPEQIPLHTLLTSFGVFSGTVVFRKFGSPEEFDRMLSYLIKAIAFCCAYLVYWLVSLALL